MRVTRDLGVHIDLSADLRGLFITYHGTELLLSLLYNYTNFAHLTHITYCNVLKHVLNDAFLSFSKLH